MTRCCCFLKYATRITFLGFSVRECFAWKTRAAKLVRLGPWLSWLAFPTSLCLTAPHSVYRRTTTKLGIIITQILPQSSSITHSFTQQKKTYNNILERMCLLGVCLPVPLNWSGFNFKCKPSVSHKDIRDNERNNSAGLLSIPSTRESLSPILCGCLLTLYSTI